MFLLSEICGEQNMHDTRLPVRQKILTKEKFDEFDGNVNI